MRTGLALQQLVANHALQNVGARLQPKYLIGQIDRSGLFRFKRR